VGFKQPMERMSSGGMNPIIGSTRSALELCIVAVDGTEVNVL